MISKLEELEAAADTAYLAYDAACAAAAAYAEVVYADAYAAGYADAASELRRLQGDK